MNGLTSGIRQVLVGAAKAISPLDHSGEAAGEETPTGQRAERPDKKAKKKAA